MVHDSEFAFRGALKPSTPGHDRCHSTPAAAAAAATAAGPAQKEEVSEQAHQVLEPPAGRLSFFIDVAHTPESMVTCAQWYAQAAGHSNVIGSGKILVLLVPVEL